MGARISYGPRRVPGPRGMWLSGRRRDCNRRSCCTYPAGGCVLPSGVVAADETGCESPWTCWRIGRLRPQRHAGRHDPRATAGRGHTGDSGSGPSGSTCRAHQPSRRLDPRGPSSRPMNSAPQTDVPPCRQTSCPEPSTRVDPRPLCARRQRACSR